MVVNKDLPDLYRPETYVRRIQRDWAPHGLQRQEGLREVEVTTISSIRRAVRSIIEHAPDAHTFHVTVYYIIGSTVFQKETHLFFLPGPCLLHRQHLIFFRRGRGNDLLFIDSGDLDLRGKTGS